jgi:hypothetical protein
MNEEEKTEQKEQTEQSGQVEQAEQRQEGKRTKMCKLAVLSILCVVAAFVFGWMLIFPTEGILPNWIEFNLLSAIKVAFVVALVLGIVSLIRIKLSAGRLAGRRLAWLGLIIPIVVGVAFLRSIEPEEEAQITPGRECQNNLRRLAAAFSMYQQNNDGQFPAVEKWCDELLETAISDKSMFKCPATKEGRCNYALNVYVAELEGDISEDMVFLFESKPGWNQIGGPELAVAGHQDRSGRKVCHVILGNSRGVAVDISEINDLNWEGGEESEETEEEDEEEGEENIPSATST